MDMTELDENGQPLNIAFNYSRNRDKATYTLYGILQGIVADKKLSNSEIMFLDLWLQSQEHLVDNGDVIDLLNEIGDIVEDGYISSNELETLKNSILDIIEYGKTESNVLADSINELIGLLMGISSDSVVTEEEIEMLENWLLLNTSIANIWSANILIERIDKIKEDGIIDETEKKDLLETLKQIAGQRFNETGDATSGVSEIFSSDISEFDIHNKKICFSGKFVSGNRNTCAKSAISKGAQVINKITSEVDALVLGTIVSRDWRFSSYGRKIEKVLELRSKGKEIPIISERIWLKIIKHT